MKPNYLLVFEVLPVFAGLVLAMLLVLLVLLVFAGVIVAAGVVAAGVAVATGLLTLVPVLLLLAAGSGQAAPNKPNVKTAERAITFFISIKFSCLLQRMYVYLLFNDLPRKVESLNLFWNNGQYKRQIL